MKKALLVVALAACLPAAPPRKPKLVVAIIVDQFRYDYLTRYRSEYTAGLDRLLTKGAVFTNARLIHFPTVTAVGHSTFLSGATPSVSGIIGNEWFDREEGKRVASITDSTTRLLGGNGGEGASPRRMLVDTVGDELKMAHHEKSRVIGISLKDRAAILPVGHAADGAYWFDSASGSFVSSTYYFPEVPAWVKGFNDEHPGEKYRGVTWLDHKLPDDVKALYGNDARSPLESSPFGNELVEQFVERALVAEKLGKHEACDLLTVSYSSNDKVGHDYGTYSAESHALALETDKVLDKLFQALERQVGMENVLVVLSADHGVAPSGQEGASNRMIGGRLPGNGVRTAVQAALVKKYGEGNWVSYSSDSVVYLNYELLGQKSADVAEASRLAARALMELPHVARAYTKEQLLSGSVPHDEVGQRLLNGAHARRGPDVVYVLDPFWTAAGSVGNHGAPYGYDTHVPMLFLGTGIRAGRYDGNVSMNDIAPTLATILDVETPAGSVGRVLAEMFQQ